MILVTGAAGQLGRLVIEHLLEKYPAHKIVAAVRHPEKVKDLQDRGVIIRLGDYERPEQWPAVLEGVSKVLLISGPEVGKRIAHHKTVVDALKDCSTVKLIAYTSMLRADSSAVPYASEDRETERMIKEAGLPYVFLRHGWYTENYTMNAGYALQGGKFFGCAKKGRISGASRNDYAQAAATILSSMDSLKPIYELAGDTSFTLSDVAAEISKQAGVPVSYIDMPEAEYRALMVSYGLSENLATTLAQADTAAADGEVYNEGNDLSALIGRGTTPLATLVKSALANADAVY
ncbi:NAD(P)H dehydrogenase (quinone) [Pseudomonas sp. BIGb0408]|uniref:NAD(P)H dehydrogenase (Quinone) n=1 Tax=Phytopseudomonas flavescens TaxID=29435 RepID=A0A7Y9XKM9_9GAMM|nr:MULTISPECIES: SDR family oxidoreductase [Pseudomonas]MCW2292305.1 NAD(P)H dehydrogenase (quinone) [Pseudomonas sp. BIGb0408]NYH73123.1 NAD(P)H dehydrogenase (quinone) [Pseudomonas flavescens]